MTNEIRDNSVSTLFEVAHRRGLWEVTRDGRFYGHYFSRQSSFDAIESAAHAAMASGGSADIVLRGQRLPLAPPLRTRAPS